MRRFSPGVRRKDSILTEHASRLCFENESGTASNSFSRTARMKVEGLLAVNRSLKTQQCLKGGRSCRLGNFKTHPSFQYNVNSIFCNDETKSERISCIEKKRGPSLSKRRASSFSFFHPPAYPLKPLSAADGEAFQEDNQ